MYFLRVVCTIAILVGGAFAGDHSAIVSGRVLLPDGTPAAGASVYLKRLDSVGVGRPATVITNRNGTYEITEVKPGLYAVHAFMEDNGYPDIVFSFYLPAGKQLAPRVQVFANGRADAGDTKLPPKPGIVHFRVTDQSTGRVMANVHYRLCQELQPDQCINGNASGSRDQSVPASTPLLVAVSSPGYIARTYTGVQLTSGEERDIAIPLTKQ